MFKVSQRQLCHKLLLQRKEGIRFFLYMGPGYFISKAVLLAMTIFLFFQNDPLLYSAALVSFGYLLGMISAHVRSFIVLKRSWPIHQKLIDWGKVEMHFENKNTQTKQRIQ